MDIIISCGLGNNKSSKKITLFISVTNDK